MSISVRESSKKDAQKAILERFLDVVKYLKSAKGISSNKEIADILAVSPQNFSHIKSGARFLTVDMLVNLTSAYRELNLEWLLTDRGEMLQYTDEKGNAKGIPYYGEVWATASVVEGELNSPEEPSGYILIPGLEDCSAAISISGDSMHPRFEPGDIIVIKKTGKDFILWGNVYLIITAEHRTVKILHPGIEEGTIKLVSANDLYPPVTLYLDDVIHLFLVKGRVQRLNM